MHIFLKLFFGVNFYIALSQADLVRVPCNRRLLRPPVITTILRKVTPENHNSYFKSVGPQLRINYNFQRTADPYFAAPYASTQLLRGGPELGSGLGYGTVWPRLRADGPDLMKVSTLDTNTFTFSKFKPGLGVVEPGFGSLGPGLERTGLGTGRPGLSPVRPGSGTKNTGLGTGGSVLGTNEIGMWTGRSDLGTVGSGLGTENLRLETRVPISGTEETSLWTRGKQSGTKEIELLTRGSGIRLDGPAIGARLPQAGTGDLGFKSVWPRLDTRAPRLDTGNPGLKYLGPELGTNRPGFATGEPVSWDMQTVVPRLRVEGRESRTGGASLIVAGNTIEEDDSKSLRCGQLRCPTYELGPPVCASDYASGKVATFNDLCDMKRHNCRYNTVFRVILNEICPWEFKS